MASIKAYKLKTGITKYEIYVSNGINPGTGKQNKIHKQGFDSYDDADRAAKILEGEIAARKYVKKNPESMTLSSFFEDWLENYQGATKEGTQITNRQVYESYIKDNLGNFQLDKYDAHAHQKFINKLFDDKSLGKQKNGLARNTVLSINSTLQKAFQVAVKRELIDKNPCSNVYLRRDDSEDTFNYYDFSETEAFLEQAKKEADPMWYPYFLLLLDQGPRKAEAAAFEWRHFDFANNDIYIDQIRLFSAEKGKLKDATIIDKPKTKSSKRSVKMTQRTKHALLTYRNYLLNYFDGELPLTADGRSFVFIQTKYTNAGKLMRSRTINNAADRIEKKAGLRKMKVHDFRHTFAVRMREAGVSLEDIRDILGHTSIATTKIYATITPLVKKKAFDQFELFISEQAKNHS